jgi:hypothetical protein
VGYELGFGVGCIDGPEEKKRNQISLKKKKTGIFHDDIFERLYFIISQRAQWRN